MKIMRMQMDIFDNADQLNILIPTYDINFNLFSLFVKDLLTF
jgi:hypothetical protein